MSHAKRRGHYSQMFRLGEVPTVEVNALKGCTLAATHLRCTRTDLGKTAPYAPEATFMVSLQLEHLCSHELRYNGKRKPIEDYAENTLTIYDLMDEWQADLRQPFDVFHLHIPTASLGELCDEHGVRHIDRLNCDPARGNIDHTMRLLVEALLPILQGKQAASQLFSDHLLLAMREHVAGCYGGFNSFRANFRGGLAPWQRQRAIDFLLAHIDHDTSLEELAATCGISVSHLIRAFKRTLGATPHRWLTQRRVERAARLLHSERTLAEIALDCGFADQSHLTRAFSQHYGVSPGRYRRREGITRAGDER